MRIALRRLLAPRGYEVVLFGSGEDSVAMAYKDAVRSYTLNKPFEGVIRNLQRRFSETDSAWVREELGRYRSTQACTECAGSRLRREARHVKIGEGEQAAR